MCGGVCVFLKNKDYIILCLEPNVDFLQTLTKNIWTDQDGVLQEQPSLYPLYTPNLLAQLIKHAKYHLLVVGRVSAAWGRRWSGILGHTCPACVFFTFENLSAESNSVAFVTMGRMKEGRKGLAILAIQYLHSLWLHYGQTPKLFAWKTPLLLSSESGCKETVAPRDLVWAVISLSWTERGLLSLYKVHH